MLWQLLEPTVVFAAIVALFAGAMMVLVKNLSLQMFDDPRCICGHTRYDHDASFDSAPCSRCRCRAFIRR